MILIVAFALAILVALLRGGRMAYLTHIPFQHGWLAIVALGLQLAAVRGNLPGHLFTAALMLGSQVLLATLVWVNRRLAGMGLLGLGLLLNLTVMLANGGYMPIAPATIERAGLTHLVTNLQPGTPVMGAKDILLPRAQTHLWLLSDIVVVRTPLTAVFSLGDAFLALGAFVFIQGALLPCPGRQDLPIDARREDVEL